MSSNPIIFAIENTERTEVDEIDGSDIETGSRAFRRLGGTGSG
jgi:hypothetical protein